MSFSRRVAICSLAPYEAVLHQKTAPDEKELFVPPSHGHCHQLVFVQLR